MKKILFITSLYTPHVGGIETMVTELSRRYIKLGFKVSIITKQWPSTLTPFEVIEGVSVYRVPSAKTETEFSDLIETIKKIELDLHSDVIHVVGVRRPLPLIGLMLARKWGVPVIMTIAGGDIPDPVDPNPGLIWNQGVEFVPDSIKQADCINSVSNFLSNHLQLLLPEVGNIGTLYAGINVSEIKKISPKNFSESYIFAFRRLDPSKGIDVLIKSFNLIKDIFPKLHLVIAGDGEEKGNLLQLVQKLGLEHRVSFVGTITLSEGIALLKGAEFTVVPSISEGGGLVNIEAQAAGCLVIASNVGGIPEYVIDGYSGILFNCGDVNELAEVMKRVLNNKDLKQKLIHGGYKHAELFDWDVLVPQYINLYTDTLSKYSAKEFEPWSVLTKDLWLKLIS